MRPLIQKMILYTAKKNNLIPFINRELFNSINRYNLITNLDNILDYNKPRIDMLETNISNFSSSLNRFIKIVVVQCIDSIYQYYPKSLFDELMVKDGFFDVKTFDEYLQIYLFGNNQIMKDGSIDKIMWYQVLLRAFSWSTTLMEFDKIYALHSEIIDETCRKLTTLE